MAIQQIATERVCVPMVRIGAAAAPADSRQTILLVTGDADLRAVAARVLAREGYRVITAAHSGHALLASARTECIDIVLAELTTDEMSGPALTERLRRDHKELQAVYFAAAGTRDCEGVLVRPFTRDDLLLQIETVSAISAS